MDKELRIQELKDEVIRLMILVNDLEADKKAETKSFNDLIRERKVELDVHLSELKSLQIR